MFVPLGTFDYAEDVPGNNASLCSLAIRAGHQCGNHFKVHAAALALLNGYCGGMRLGIAKYVFLHARKAVFGVFPDC